MTTRVAAKIVLSQFGFRPPDSYVSGSIDGLRIGSVVTATNVDDEGVIAWEWSLEPNVNSVVSAWGVAGANGATLTCTPPVAGDTYLRLRVTGARLPDGSPNVAEDTVILGLRVPSTSYAGGYPVPHPKETSAGGGAVVDPALGREARLAEMGFAIGAAQGAPARNRITILAGPFTTSFGPASPETVGSFLWDPSVIPAHAGNVSIKVYALGASTNGSNLGTVDLFDPTAHAEIAGSPVSLASTGEPAEASSDVTAAMQSLAARTLRARINLATDATTDHATAYAVRLEILWS